jgi:hypothetical protein
MDDDAFARRVVAAGQVRGNVRPYPVLPGAGFLVLLDQNQRKPWQARVSLSAGSENRGNGCGVDLGPGLPHTPTTLERLVEIMDVAIRTCDPDQATIATFGMAELETPGGREGTRLGWLTYFSERVLSGWASMPVFPAGVALSTSRVGGLIVQLTGHWFDHANGQDQELLSRTRSALDAVAGD